MKHSLIVAAVALLAGLLWTTDAFAWEVEYNAGSGLLPTEASPPWQLYAYNAVTPTVSDGLLHIQGAADTSYTLYGRETGIAAGVPVTVEARMRVAAGGTRAPVLSIQTKGCFAAVLIYPDHLSGYDWGQGVVTYPTDLTTLRRYG